MTSISDVVARAKAFLSNRQRAYNVAFSGPPGELVLKDLAKFCRACDSTFHKDPQIQAALEGRREVWLRIQKHLQLSDEKLWQLMDGRGE